jgi:hypothetical protein
MTTEQKAAEHAQFMVLFYWEDRAPDVSDEERARRDQAFERWSRAVETRGELVVSEKVDPDGAPVWLRGPEGRPIAPEDCPATPAVLDRYCVVRARDREAALELARHSPHLEHGGLVAVVTPLQ